MAKDGLMCIMDEDDIGGCAITYLPCLAFNGAKRINKDVYIRALINSTIHLSELDSYMWMQCIGLFVDVHSRIHTFVCLSLHFIAHLGARQHTFFAHARGWGWSIALTLPKQRSKNTLGVVNLQYLLSLCINI